MPNNTVLLQCTCLIDRKSPSEAGRTKLIQRKESFVMFMFPVNDACHELELNLTEHNKP